MLDLLRQTFQRHAARLRQLSLALLHLAVLRNALGLVAVRHHQERVARIRHPLESKDLHRRRRPGFRNRPPAVVEHRANLAKRVADNVAVAGLQRSVLHQHRRHSAAPAIQLRFDHRTHSRTIRRSLQVAQIGHQADHLLQQVQVRPLLRRNIHEHGRSAPCLRLQSAIRQLLLHLVGIRIRLVDLVHRHDDRHIRRLRVVDRLQRLRHHAIVRRNHDDHDVRDLRAARTHPCKRLVTRSIQEHDLAPERRRIRLRDLHLVSADVLRNSASLTRRHIRRTNRIQQRSLTVIDVAHNRNHRRPRNLDHPRRIFQEAFDRLVLQLLFDRDHRRVRAKLPRHVLHQVRRPATGSPSRTRPSSAASQSGPCRAHPASPPGP